MHMLASDDAERQEALETLRLRVLRFRNREVRDDLPAVLRRISESLAP